MSNYEVLGIPNGSSIDDVKKAYRSLVKQYHPDKTNNDPIKNKKFILIQKAYEDILIGKTGLKEAQYKQNKQQEDLKSYYSVSVSFSEDNKTCDITVYVVNCSSVSVFVGDKYASKNVIGKRVANFWIETKELKKSNIVSVSVTSVSGNKVFKAIEVTLPKKESVLKRIMNKISEII